MGRLTPWKWLTDQLSSLPPVSQFVGAADLAGKTVIVTGANVGIGLEAARHFAALGPQKLILGCRDSKKAGDAVQSIRVTTGFQAVEAWSLDLASFASVRAFAERFELEGGGHLDLLVENAGAWFNDYAATADGWESSLQVNHLGPSLLALLLLPSLLKATSSPPTPRLVLVASEGHFFVSSLPEAKSPKILDKLNDEQYCLSSRTMRSRYPVTKLMNVFFTRSLAFRLPPPPAGLLAVACVNPGFCRTELGRWVSGPLIVIKYIAELLFARTTEVGSRTLVWTALGGEQGKVHGRYTSRCRVEEESDLVLSKEGSEIEERIWNETIDALSRVDARVKHVVEECLRSF